MGDLSSALIGTKIKVPERYGSGLDVRTVTVITAANVMCGSIRLRKSDGLVIGSGSCSGWGRRYASIATDADLLTHRIARAKSKLQSIKVTAENLETVERLIAESERT